MPTAHLIHGFNVSDGGARTVGRLRPSLEAAGWRVRLHDYGWTGPLLLRLANRRVVRELQAAIAPGDVVIGHSNGCLIAWQLAECSRLSAVVCIQPALRRDTRWCTPVLCLYNRHDWAVRFGRLWARLASRLTRRWHGWGAAGASGFAPGPNITNWDTADPSVYAPARGHSAVFQEPALTLWGSRIRRWLPEPDGVA